MQNEKMLEILYRIQVCLEMDSLDIAREYTRLELENLREITESKCKNSRYYCEDWYCSDCHNLNCTGKLNKKLCSY